MANEMRAGADLSQLLSNFVRGGYKRLTKLAEKKRLKNCFNLCGSSGELA